MLGDDAFTTDGPTPKIALCAAAFEPRKRHAELLEAFAKAAEKAPCARLVLLGEGPGRAKVEAKIAALGLEGRVHLLGHRSDIERWIATADICVLSSEREGLPRVVLQYVMAGKPVVATALPGLERVVRHGVSGYLVSLAHVDQMAIPMAALLNDDVGRRRLATAAREVDLSDWSVDRMTRAIEAIYSDALQARAEARA
jgi:glycosyltransferase involved in cell wall biosynthesis